MKLLSLLILLSPVLVNAQTKPDTVFVDKVYLVDRLIDRQTGRVLRKWVRKKKVKCGYIINLYDNVWLVNNREMYLMEKNDNDGNFKIKNK